MNNSSFNSFCAMVNGFEKPEEFTHGSLFSGIGGFDLAAEWMGWKNIFHCEKEPFPRKILNYYWPNAISYEDIKKTDFKKHHGTIDIISGGFPCQPYSIAGKRLGKEDDRHLWPEMLRAIREIKPIYVVGENVYGIVNWNGGMVFDEVQTDMEAEGYEVLPTILPACAKNAPHRRDRTWFVAYSDKCANRSSRKGGRLIEKGCKNNDEPKEWRKPAKQYFRCSNVPRTFANSTNSGAKSLRQERKDSIHEPKITTNPQITYKQWEGICKKQQKKEIRRCYPGHNEFENFPTQSPVCGRNDGIPTKLDRITVSSKRGRRTLNNKQAISKHKKESIKAYGNAIVPQVAYEIFKAIQITNGQSAEEKLLKRQKPTRLK